MGKQSEILEEVLQTENDHLSDVHMVPPEGLTVWHLVALWCGF